MINIDTTGIQPIPEELLDDAHKAYSRITDTSGSFKDKNGWVKLPFTSTNELNMIKAAAEKIRRESRVVVVLGIGGSYLGARAAIEFLKGDKYNLSAVKSPKIFFAGNNISPAYTKKIMALSALEDISLIVVSKSGNTLETTVAFRVFLNLMHAKYGDRISERVYVITDAKSGALREYSSLSGCASFSIPENIVGRYSVLSPSGLLPMAVAGIDIEDVIKGAQDTANVSTEAAITYAAARRLLYKSGKKIELIASFEPDFRYMGEWWRQLFAESEGKQHKGIFPIFEEFPADLHSIGQYIQDGERTIFETFINFDTSSSKLIIPQCEINDGYDTLMGVDYNVVADTTRRGVKKAHTEGGIPVIELSTGDITPFTFGSITQFFMLACSISALMLGVNPFDQPGVEAYKNNFHVFFPSVDK